MEKKAYTDHIDYAALTVQAHQARSQYLATLVKNGWSLAVQMFNQQPSAAEPVSRPFQAGERRA
ncbi:MAG: hypothetical protein KDI79_22555 [Anaerolineae bacterium]|nr:hypothetical protein [Anaerolineae bacterium]